MARISNPITFSRHFDFDANKLDSAGATDPTLTFDTRLFIDPLLLAGCRQVEISKDAAANFRLHFERIAKLLSRSTHENDRLWSAAADLFDFRETAPAKGTGLGYGANSVSGRGFGPELTARLMKTAKEIIDLGITDPDLFLLLGLLEDGVGPDLIGDMTTRIILPDLVRFNARVLEDFLPTILRDYEYEMPNGSVVRLPTNPYSPMPLPVVLVPTDILRKLPIALSWSDIADAASKNERIRKRTNQEIGGIWVSFSRRDKARLRAEAFKDPDVLKALLATVKRVPQTPYDSRGDPAGEVFWHELARYLLEREPFNVPAPLSHDADGLRQVVRRIIEQFRHLVEERDLAKELWTGDRPRHEKASQRLFFVVADCYCRASNIDITPEAETGVGPVDFKFSRGYSTRLLVEIKLSTSKKVTAGYEKQIIAYARGESAAALYLIINVGGRFESLRKRLDAARLHALKESRFAPELIYIDGNVKTSASKR
jgi:hypothetical protein